MVFCLNRIKKSESLAQSAKIKQDQNHSSCVNQTAKTKFPHTYAVPQPNKNSRKMPVAGTDHLADKLRQNWMAKYPLDTCSNGGINLDDSLTSLNWLHSLNIMKLATPTPPPSPDPYEDCHYTKNFKVNPNAVLNVSYASPVIKTEPIFQITDTVPSPPTTPDSDSIDFKNNPYVKPPYSYATLICMAMKETKKTKITLSAIYNWITENFMYYRMADPSWQNSIRHNLSLNKCFQKVPRRKDEPGKGGFWRINPDYNDMIENGVLKKRRCGRDIVCPTPVKRVRREDYNPSFSAIHPRIDANMNQIVHFEDDTYKEDFNWAAIMNQDIEVAGTRVKTEIILDKVDIEASPLIAMSPPTSETNSDDFSIEEFFTQSSGDDPLDFITNDPLDLTINGHYIKAPEWWDESMNNMNSEHLIGLSTCENNGLHTPVSSSPVRDQEYPAWVTIQADSDLPHIETAFDVDNLFDIENIPSPNVL
ncbi:hypothetical protein ScPMuIL_005041 [Solemya velum]